MLGAGFAVFKRRGASDRSAASRLDDPVSHGDIHATIYRALGVDSQSLMIPDHLGRPTPLHDPGRAIVRLVG